MKPEVADMTGGSHFLFFFFFFYCTGRTATRLHSSVIIRYKMVLFVTFYYLSKMIK